MNKEEIIRRLKKISEHAVHMNWKANFLILSLDDGIALNEAVRLLKEQETHDTRKSRIFQCEKCGYGIDDIFLNDESNYPITPVYCPNCGRLVKCNE